MKTFVKKDIFSWTNAEDAHCYVGKDGYFSNTLISLENAIDLNKIHTLKEINPIHGLSFIAENHAQYSFFLPADKVKEVEEKKWRACKNFEEFKACTHRDIGDVIVFKEKNTEPINTALVTGYHKSCLHKLGLGYMCYSFQELFNNYLWLDTNNNWLPFGVLDES